MYYTVRKWDFLFRDNAIYKRSAILLFLPVLFYFATPWWQSYQQKLILNACVLLLMPGLFYLTRTSSLDRLAGEVSYPDYLIRILTATILKKIGLEENWIGPANIFIATGLLFFLVRIVRPIEILRQHFSRGQAMAHA